MGVVAQTISLELMVITMWSVAVDTIIPMGRKVRCRVVRVIQLRRATMVPLVVETAIVFCKHPPDIMPSAAVSLIRQKVSTLQYRVERIMLPLEKELSLWEEKMESLGTEELSWVVLRIEHSPKVPWPWVVNKIKPMVLIPLPWV